MNDRLPVYLHLADALESEIARLGPGHPIASEHELAQTHNISRVTARAVLEELQRRFLVRRSQGRRTVVVERIPYAVGPTVSPSFSETVRRGGGTPASRTIALRRRKPDAAVRAALALPIGESALFLARKRYVNDELAAYAETWLAPDLVPDLGTILGERGSLFSVLRDAYALAPVRASSRAEYIVAPALIARKLESDERPIVFALSGQTDSAKLGRPIEVTSSWLRADMFRVVFDLDGPARP